MILARTNMKELPACCTECVMWHDDSGTCRVSGYNAMIAAVTGNRPDWCPLVEAVKDKEQTNEPKPRHDKCPQCNNLTLVYDYDRNGELYELCLNCGYTTLTEYKEKTND